MMPDDYALLNKYFETRSRAQEGAMAQNMCRGESARPCVQASASETHMEPSYDLTRTTVRSCVSM